MDKYFVSVSLVNVYNIIWRIFLICTKIVIQVELTVSPKNITGKLHTLKIITGLLLLFVMGLIMVVFAGRRTKNEQAEQLCKHHDAHQENHDFRAHTVHA